MGRGYSICRCMHMIDNRAGNLSNDREWRVKETWITSQGQCMNSVLLTAVLKSMDHGHIQTDHNDISRNVIKLFNVLQLTHKLTIYPAN